MTWTFIANVDKAQVTDFCSIAFSDNQVSMGYSNDEGNVKHGSFFHLKGQSRTKILAGPRLG